MGSNPASADRDKDSLEQALEPAAEPVDFAVEMQIAEAVNAFAQSMGSVFREAGKSVLNVFQQLHRAVSRRSRGQHSGHKNGGNPETCGHEQGGPRMLAHVVFKLKGGIRIYGWDGRNGRGGGIGGWVHEFGWLEVF